MRLYQQFIAPNILPSTSASRFGQEILHLETDLPPAGGSALNALPQRRLGICISSSNGPFDKVKQDKENKVRYVRVIKRNQNLYLIFHNRADNFFVRKTELLSLMTHRSAACYGHEIFSNYTIKL
jgi:hypothetical protein